MPSATPMKPRAMRWRRLGGAALSAGFLVTGAVGLQAATSVRTGTHVTLATCRGDPWTSPTYQASSTPELLGAEVLACLKLEYPRTYQHDEVGIVALVHVGRFQNINEFGISSTVRHQLQLLGIPPITLEDGPGGLIVNGNPKPTQLPNELALGATFDPTLAQLYGTILGAEAHAMGFDGVQAPDLNLVRVPAWGRAMESFGESPVLAGTLGGAEAAALLSQDEIPVLKHFGPYSQETDRHQLDQRISQRAYQEVYIRPFIIALHAVQPILKAGHHAVGIMCSYGNVDATRACRSPELAHLLDRVGINALVRSDLDVWVPPTALLENAIDLIKPMASVLLTRALGEPAVDRALDQAVVQIFANEFADGLVQPRVALPTFHNLSPRLAAIGGIDAQEIEQRAAVLLKNDGVLPLKHGVGPIAVVADARVAGTCRHLATALAHDLGTEAFCDDPLAPVPHTWLFAAPKYQHRLSSVLREFTPTQTGNYVVNVTTFDTTSLVMNGKLVVSTDGYSAFGVQRTALVYLQAGERYWFDLRYVGLGPRTSINFEQPVIDAAVTKLQGARAAVVIGYDLTREGMDRSSLALSNAQDALISAIAAKVPTVALLATDGAVTMPWLNQVQAVLEVWNPTGMVYTDAELTKFVDAYANVLDGTSDPSGRLPVTFPVSASRSPMAVPGFWPGIGHTVNLGLAPDTGLGIGYDWYRQAGWPVLFPFGYGLSYTTYQLLGGTVTDSPAGPQVNVAVRDTGAAAGTEIVQIYADFPSALNEPATQLVGFAPVTFSASDVASRTVHHVSIPISADALSVYLGGGLQVLPGQYCLEAATYEGDPHAWSTGPMSIAPAPGGTMTATPTRLNPGGCPG